MKLEDPATIRVLKIVSLAVLGLLLILELFVEHHPHFGVDGTFGFSAWYGFGSCVAMVVISKIVIGSILKRKDSYYND